MTSVTCTSEPPGMETFPLYGDFTGTLRGLFSMETFSLSMETFSLYGVLEVSEMHNIVVSEIHNIEVSENIRVKTFFVVSKIYLVGVRQRSLEVSNLACKG